MTGGGGKRSRRLEDRAKIWLLERIIKGMTGCKEIKYHFYSKIKKYDDIPYSFGYVELKDMMYDYVPKILYDEGLEVDVLPDIVESEFKKGKYEPTLNCEIHFSMDPWSEVKKLRKQVEELGKKGGKK